MPAFHLYIAMKASQLLISTLRQAPADAEVASQALMLRAGFIRKLAAGIYTYMPLALRSYRKIEAIVREEMNASGALEILMPVIQPAELWQETRRFHDYGAELLRIKDRHERDFVVQPTSEEVVTDIGRDLLRSYRRLPVNLYHIQTKFRDERRPRFGLLRAREFTMKDAYSFDRNIVAAKQSYQLMYHTYQRIFKRFGFEFRVVSADTGAIGGTMSHEFHVITDTGEDLLAYCPDSDYACNVELAEALPLLENRAPAAQALTKVATPGQARCSDVAQYLQLPLAQTLKSIVLATEDDSKIKLHLLLLRGDHSLNEIKVAKLPGMRGFRFATVAEIFSAFACEPGYLGPLGMSGKVNIIADSTVALMSDFVAGANEKDYHIQGINWNRDLPEADLVADIRNVENGDPSPDGKGKLALCRGIEVGHVFYLGTKYSEAMHAVYLDEQGKESLIEMGCYGLGISRVLAACVEQNHDEHGIIWPDAIAPFDWVVCPIGGQQSQRVQQQAEQIYQQLKTLGCDVVLDDRQERAGAMFADWDLIGIPHRIVISERGLAKAELEYKARRSQTPVNWGIHEFEQQVKALRANVSR